MASRRLTAALIAGGVAVGCGLPVASAAAGAGLHVRDRLAFRHLDGARVKFGRELRVWCGPWAPDVPVPSIHVRVGSRSRTGGTAVWELDAVVADVKRRPVVRLPHAFVFDHPTGAQLFAAAGGDELNSDTEGSAGRIRFERVSCGRRMRIAFRVRARIGSEFSDGEPLKVRGSFRASTAPA